VDTPRFSVPEFFGDLRKILVNRNYLWLLVGLFSLSVTAGVRDSLLLYVNVYFWGFSTEEISLFAVGSFLGYLAGFLLTARLHAIWGKRQVMVWSAIGNAFFPALGIMLHFAGVMFAKGDTWLLPTLIAISVGTWATSSALNISALSALADIADENEARFGVRQEGILYSARAMFAKLDYAIGTAIAGAILTLIAFPKKAEPGLIDPMIVDNLGYLYGPIAMIPALIAAVFYAQYNISKQRHAESRRLISEASVRRESVGGEP
jgi:Na+/melibiose symporter-like transporter